MKQDKIWVVATLVLGLVLGTTDQIQAQTLTWLGTLGDDRSIARGISTGDSVVVGETRDANGRNRAFRWENGVMQDLGTFGGTTSEANGVSANGGVVVGKANNENEIAVAFRWTASNGMEDLNQTYADLLTDGSSLIEAYAISSDGRYIGTCN